MSAASPTEVEAIVAIAIYDVIVKLILDTETPNDWERMCSAGTYIKLLRVENQAA
jgi:hypothetical protein